jgi:hypothetical protein
MAAAALALVSLALMGWALSALPASLALPEAPDALTVFGAALAMATFPVVGLMVAIRRPDHAIGWLFLLAGLGLSVGIATGEYITQVIHVGRDLPAVEFVAWVGEWGWSVSFFLAVPLAIILFPDVRPSRAGRVLAVVIILAAVATILGTAFGTTTLSDGAFVNPFSAPQPVRDALAAAGQVTDVLNMPLVALAIVDLIVRARGSRGVQRQQFKWFAAAVAVVLVGVALALPPVFIFGEDTASIPALAEAIGNFGWSLVLLGVGLIPVATGAAILRYRLFDIDRILSRTVSWAVVTGVLLIVFGAAVLALQTILSSVTQGETLAVAVSTLVAFALFQPLRRRVQAVVDRRFDRSRVDRDRLAGHFAGALRDELEMERVLARLVATIDEAVRPSRVGVWWLARDEERRGR